MYYFFINLDRRKDRREQFEKEIEKIGIQVERFPAIVDSIPALGCTISHLSVLKIARQRNYESVCIFEDDFEFLISQEEYKNILANIPHDFDVVMLGWYIFKSTPYNDTFGKVIHATTASGYVVNKKFYDTLIQNLEEAVTLFRENMNQYDAVSKYINDQYWIRIQPYAQWLYTLKRVGHQRPSISDLVGKYVAYEY